MTKLDMEYKRLFVSRKILAIIAVMIGLGACSSSEAIQDAVEQSQQIDSQESTSTQQDVPRTDNPVIITYQNASSNIEISLDPGQDQFYLDLKGMAPSEKDSIVVVDSTLIKNRANDIQTLLASYRRAQDLFYLGEYRDALNEVDKTLDIQETADALALKGTIFFMLDNITAARANWNEAVRLDPNIPVPSIPELETLINEIREDGDQ